MNEYSQMVKDLAKPGQDIIVTLTPEMANTLHMAVGLCGEAGEVKEIQLLTCTKTALSDSSYIEELGDCEFYFEGMCQSMHLTIEQATPADFDVFCIDRLVVAASNTLDLVKKMAIYNKDVDLMIFVNSLMEIRKYLDMIYIYTGLTQAEAKDHNMRKLLKGKNARYREGTYSDEAAQSRRDKVIKD